MKVEIKNVTKKYGNYKAISDMNIQIEEGTIHGLIGENGSGKTTLIKCITGIYKVTNGEILVENENIYENPKMKEKVGYVADNCQYFPTYRLGKMVKFYKEVYKKFDEEKFIKMNNTFNLDMNKRVNELSKGQKMRLSFMLNLAICPEILVLDEPTSGLDAMAKKELFKYLIEEVEKTNLTVIISSHNLTDIERICDNVSIIKNGKISKQNSMENVMKMARKFQIVFENGAPAGFLSNEKIISVMNVGNIYTITYSEITDDEIDLIKKLNPVYMEEININLEDVFVYTNGGDSNGGKGII